MKNKILNFIIGMLVGAIITTIGFYIYEKMNTGNNIDIEQNMRQEGNPYNGGTPPEKPTGGQMNNQMTPPEMPSNNRGMTMNAQGNSI